MNQETQFERPKSVNLLSFIATLLLIVSGISATGVSIYRSSLQSQIKSKSASLEAAKARFDIDTVTAMQELDRRINASKEVLADHVVVSPVFEALQAETLKSISFTKFAYTYDPLKKSVDVSMSGKATGYEAIALQSDELVKNKYIKDPVFSNLNVDDKGRVVFDLQFSVDASYINFDDVLSRDASSVSPVSSGQDINQSATSQVGGAPTQ